jgi:type III secretory pathway component EscS
MARRASRTAAIDTTKEVRLTVKVGSLAAFAGIAIGLSLAAYQVQGWTMPRPLGITVIAVLLAMAAVALAMLAYELIRAFLRFLEHRTTTPSVVLSEPPGLVDYQPDAERASKLFIRVLNKLNHDTETLGKKLERSSRRMTRAVRRNPRARQRIANRAARNIDKSASYIEKRLERLQALVMDMGRSHQGWMQSLSVDTDEDRKALVTLRATVVEGQQATIFAGDSISGYRRTVREMEKQNLARALTRACRRLGEALDGIEKALKRQEREQGELIRVLDAKLRET